MRYEVTPHSGYLKLNELCRNRDWFIISTNTDGLFERTGKINLLLFQLSIGFCSDRIYTPQVSDYFTLACLNSNRAIFLECNAPNLALGMLFFLQSHYMKR